MICASLRAETDEQALAGMAEARRACKDFPRRQGAGGSRMAFIPGRFERFLSQIQTSASKGGKKRGRALALKVLHALDGQSRVRRADVVQNLLNDVVDYRRDEIDRMILRLHQKGLVHSQQGPHSSLTIT